jgi:NADPH:quinone reductase-like Zn-dependent oxidoreductase
VRPGDLVVNMQRENWVQRRRGCGEDAIPVPASLDLAQAAMLRINPATALLLLEDDVVLKDGPDLAERARAATGGASIRLGIDAVSGEACRRIADCVADGGVVVSYGSMSGEDPAIGRAALNMRGVSLTGFNLGRGLAKRTASQVREIYADLAGKIRDGVLKAPIDSFYPIDDIKPALIRAQQGGRSGKVLVLPNGPL